MGDMNANLGKTGEKTFLYDLETLKKHFIALGGSGSGKTVLCKAVIEESALKNIPSILVDPQGDIASLAMHNNKLGKSKITVYTPTSSKGTPLCINPLNLPKCDMDKEDKISILDQISTSICKLLNYNVDKDKGKSAQAMLYLILSHACQKGIVLKNFNQLSELILNLPADVKNEAEAFLDIAPELAKKVKFLTIGQNELLFNFGESLDVKKMLKPGNISIIYLNSLDTKQNKEFFLSMIATSLYEWMLENPKPHLQALFYIDEVAEYIPAGALKPATKPILNLLFKQARKYGLGCILSTQNPGDIDYKAFAQFGTWAIGRLTTKQDREKVKESLKSLSKDNMDMIIEKLPKLQPGEFLLFCPDLFKEVQEVKVRWLLSEHKTLTENDVKKLSPKKKEKVTKTSKPKQGIKFGFPHNVDDFEIHDLIDRHKKRQYGVFGPKEQLDSYKLYKHPIIKATVQASSGLIKKEQMEYDIFFDGVTGDIKNVDDKFETSIKVSELMGLSTADLTVLSQMAKKPISASKIKSKTRMEEKSINSSLKGMQKKGVIIPHKDKGQWKTAKHVSLRSLKRIKSNPILVNESIEGDSIEQKINETHIEKIINNVYGAELVDCETLHYPFYQIKYRTKGMSRIVNISSVTGKRIDL